MELRDKISKSIELLQTWNSREGFYFADSGGKDSSITRDLLIKSGVKFDSHYCVSPIDPPQIREFLKEFHPETTWDYHARGFWRLVVKRGLPTRTSRWCCEVIKEAGGTNRIVVVGNRRNESITRATQCFVEHGDKRNKGKLFIRPILDFEHEEVWRYIRDMNVPYCSLYDEGAMRKGYGEGVFKRLGCVLCPMARKKARLIEEAYFPKVANFWRTTCIQICKERSERGYMTKRGVPYKNKFTGEELYQWWLNS